TARLCSQKLLVDRKHIEASIGFHLFITLISFNKRIKNERWMYMLRKKKNRSRFNLSLHNYCSAASPLVG
ncbi:hypothetical protein M8C21_023470, partial [Ambrosia artemisiifolia]